MKSIDFNKSLKPDVLQALFSNSAIKREFNSLVKDAIKHFKKPHPHLKDWFVTIDPTVGEAFMNIDKDPTNKLILKNKEKLVGFIRDVFNFVLREWVDAFTTGGMDKSVIKLMKGLEPLLRELAKSQPQIKVPSEYKIAFRGTNALKSNIAAFVKSTDPKDWKPVKFTPAGITKANNKFMTYVGEKRFKYTPHNDVQSWSVDAKVADKFGAVTLAVPIDNSFLFNPEYLNSWGRKEAEVIHFGKQPMSTILMMPKDVYDYYRGTSDKVSNATMFESMVDGDGLLEVYN